MIFTDIALANLQNRFVALVWLLVQKGVFTLEEYEAAVAEMEKVTEEDAQLAAETLVNTHHRLHGGSE